jgi:beta-galactosidase
MLENRASFSLYMAHGGTTFGLWPGTDRPFKPDTNSYDYDAPISEAGWIGGKFEVTRDLIRSYLAEDEKLPGAPAPLPVMCVEPFRLTEIAPVRENLPAPVADARPRHMEAYDQGQGCILYRCMLPAGPACRLKIGRVNDFAWLFLDGVPAGVMDRRTRRFVVALPARDKTMQLDILVETMGHVNFGEEVHDRKGIQGPVLLDDREVQGPWKVFPLKLDNALLAALAWKPASAAPQAPAFWRGSFDVQEPADTFLDLSKWGKGVVWINGKCLARFWNIGPTQTAYAPGPWLRKGRNEVIILDLVGPSEPVLQGLEKPILDQLRPGLDFARAPSLQESLEPGTLAHAGCFESGPEVQEVRFRQPVRGGRFCIETINAHDGQPFAAIAELDILDEAGASVSREDWIIAHVDSEERTLEDGSASNAIDGQTASHWHTERSEAPPVHPHQLVIDLGREIVASGFRYTPRQGQQVTGRIKEYRVFMAAQGDQDFQGQEKSI